MGEIHSIDYSVCTAIKMLAVSVCGNNDSLVFAIAFYSCIAATHLIAAGRQIMSCALSMTAFFCSIFALRTDKITSGTVHVTKSNQWYPHTTTGSLPKLY